MSLEELIWPDRHHALTSSDSDLEGGGDCRLVQSMPLLHLIPTVTYRSHGE